MPLRGSGNVVLFRYAASEVKNIGLLQCALEARIADMRVERRRRDAFLPKQPLQEEEIDAILEEQRRGGVAQHVRRHPAGEAGASREGARRLAEGLRRPGSRARKQSRVIAVGEVRDAAAGADRR